MHLQRVEKFPLSTLKRSCRPNEGSNLVAWVKLNKENLMLQSFEGTFHEVWKVAHTMQQFLCFYNFLGLKTCKSENTAFQIKCWTSWKLRNFLFQHSNKVVDQMKAQTLLPLLKSTSTPDPKECTKYSKTKVLFKESTATKFKENEKVEEILKEKCFSSDLDFNWWISKNNMSARRLLAIDNFPMNNNQARVCL